jgi:hypothetical protein
MPPKKKRALSQDNEETATVPATKKAKTAGAKAPKTSRAKKNDDDGEFSHYLLL